MKMISWEGDIHLTVFCIQVMVSLVPYNADAEESRVSNEEKTA